MIIETIGSDEKIRFSELMKKSNGICPKTLANRLKEQVEAGLVQRTSFAEIPPRVEYTLTRDGVEVRNALGPLFKWASKKQTRDENNLTTGIIYDSSV